MRMCMRACVHACMLTCVQVGVAFAGLDEADNIGYVIPMPVVRLFLRTYDEVMPYLYMHMHMPQ